MLCRGQLLFPAHKKKDMVGQEKEGGCAIINVWPSGTDSLHPWIFFCTRKATALFPLLHQGCPTLESFSGGVHLGMGKKGNLTSSSTFLFDNQNILKEIGRKNGEVQHMHTAFFLVFIREHKNNSLN